MGATYLRVDRGVAVELWAAPVVDRDGAKVELAPADCFHADLAAAFHAAGSAAVGWTWDGKAFAAPAAPMVDLRAYAAAARYARETAGITVTTAQVATDRDSQQAITGMWAAAQIDPNITVQFKTATGAFVAINADQIRKIASAVIAHVQACYAAEAQVAADIKAGKVTTAADVDAAFTAVA